MKSSLFYSVKLGLFLCVLVFYLAISGCDKTIETGKFGEMKIGMSKEAVADVLLKDQVNMVTPVVDDLIIVINENIERLSFLSDAPGLCVRDNSGFSFSISFISGDKPEIKYISVPASKYASEMKAIKTREGIIQYIVKIFNTNSSLVVSSCLVGVGSKKINSFILKDDLSLANHDSWFYYIPDSYSTATLRFSKDSLKKIEYSWRPFEG